VSSLAANEVDDVKALVYLIGRQDEVTQLILRGARASIPRPR
jgi:hypothetical protein